MELSFLSDYLIPVITGICLCVGTVLKRWIADTGHKYIPTVCAVLGGGAGGMDEQRTLSAGAAAGNVQRSGRYRSASGISPGVERDISKTRRSLDKKLTISSSAFL